ncbi:MAG TPA: protoporphyrinogen oxidase, partial [Pirellulaceae bacterium]|nr:protoporphyrinogen oxidase [Pirellulaceae bacterium]
MHESNTPPRRVAVIGGGITGLAAAHRLVELAPSVQVTLFEASDRLGGVLRTERRDGFLVETAADNFITTVPWAIDLCRRIGFEDQLIPTNSGYRHAFVVRRGKLHHIPDGFVVMAPSKVWPIVTTPILSPLGKLRMAGELLMPRRRQAGDESLAAFIRRRFGRETYERLVQPLVGGIYTGDPSRLSLQSTMPRFAEMEQQHGSLIRAMYKQPKRKEQGSGARYSMFVAPRDGMSSLVSAIAARLPAESIRLNTPIRQLQRTERGWSLSLLNSPERAAEFDEVIVTTPAKPTSRLIATMDEELAGELDEIHHARCSIVSLAYTRDQIAHPLDGFGVVVPAIERRRILSASFSSVKYPGRAPEGSVLIRVFIGGDCQPDLADRSDEELLQIAHEELQQLLGIRGEPTMQFISWRAKMPQYFVGHTEKVSRMRSLLERHQGLELAGNAHDGVGIPNCIHSGEQAAERLMLTA